MNRTEKDNIVQQLRNTFQEKKSALLIDYTGLSVPDATDLRRQILEAKSSFQVVKNRLALRAIGDTPAEGVKEYFQGATAIVFTDEDPVAVAKVVKSFMGERPSMKFKAGFVEGQTISADQVGSLADMPSRPELLSKLMFLARAPLMGLAGALQGPLRGLASVLKQLEEQKGETKEG